MWISSPHDDLAVTGQGAERAALRVEVHPVGGGARRYRPQYGVIARHVPVLCDHTAAGGTVDALDAHVTQGLVVVHRVEGCVVGIGPLALRGIGTEPPYQLVLVKALYEADSEAFGPHRLRTEGRDERVRGLLGGDLLRGQLHRARQVSDERSERRGQQQPPRRPGFRLRGPHVRPGVDQRAHGGLVHAVYGVPERGVLVVAYVDVRDVGQERGHRLCRALFRREVQRGGATPSHPGVGWGACLQPGPDQGRVAPVAVAHALPVGLRYVALPGFLRTP